MLLSMFHTDIYTEENEDEYKKTIPRFQVTEKPVSK